MTSAEEQKHSRTSLERIRSTFPDLDAWGSRSSVIAQPEAGSELALDDAETIGWHTSQLAAAGLGAARNHLQAVRVHIEAGQTFPEATGTLIRGAMLGGSQAVWLLDPNDRAVRLRRTRLLTAEVTDNHRKCLADLLEISPGHENTRRVHDHVVKRLGEVKAKRAELDEGAKFSNTTLIEEAARATFGEGFDVAARAEWRRTSGNAHGLPWAVLGVSGTAQVSQADADGFATFTAGGAFGDILNGYTLAYRLIRRGWELFDLRSRSGA